MSLDRENNIIGGMFGLPDTVEPKDEIDIHQWKFLDDSHLFLSNGRSGILVLIDRLAPGSIWMPSYLCPSMIEAVDQKKVKLKYYEVNYDLKVSSDEWINQIETNDIVVLIDYFGFPLDSEIASLAKKRGAWILEDACQALLSRDVGQYSDFVIFSPRKFVGVPDGGILNSRCDVNFNDVELRAVPATWWLKMLEATINRREFDQYGGKRRWHRLFQESESAISPNYFAMSDLSRNLLFNAYDYEEITKRRIENYSVLANELEDIALFPLLSDNAVPLSFLVRHPDRDLIRRDLFKEQIYPPVHWQIEGLVPEEFVESHLLSNQIMTLPCDQRYGVETMYRMICCVKEALKK